MKVITDDPAMQCDECDAQVDWLLEIGQSYLCADCVKKTYDMAWAQWLNNFVKGVEEHGTGNPDMDLVPYWGKPI